MNARVSKMYPADLSGEVALVTGGSRNIGLAIARMLQDAGARICIWGVTDAAAVDKALASLEPDRSATMGMLVSVDDEDAVIGAFSKIESQLGPVSVVINNAAARPHESFTTIGLSSWKSVLDVILTGAFLTSRELFRRLPEGRKGAIVNIGGLSAHRPAQGRAHVIAAKAGLVGLTRALAAEGLGRIRANCVVPGAIDTERREGQHRPHDLDDPKYAAGRPEDVARAVLPLADPNDSYVTGQTIHVSGGRFMP